MPGRPPQPASLLREPEAATSIRTPAGDFGTAHPTPSGKEGAGGADPSRQGGSRAWAQAQYRRHQPAALRHRQGPLERYRSRCVAYGLRWRKISAEKHTSKRSPPPYTHTHTHTQTHTHTHTRTYKHACTRTHAHTFMRWHSSCARVSRSDSMPRSLRSTSSYTSAQTHTCMHAHTNSHAHLHAQVCSWVAAAERARAGQGPPTGSFTQHSVHR